MTNDRDLVETLGTVGRAFFGSFQMLREVQRLAIPPIYSGENVLVTSTTASGKTEAIMAPLVKRTKDRMPIGGHRIRMLLIAPTRALVNDLTARVAVRLEGLGLTCGRQTSDHRDKHKQPFVLITTPESFDSMLVRDGRLEAGRTVDHLLAGVLAVFIDEAHLFDGTARGDQLCWLLGRLRRLRRLNADRETELQVCAGSATISNPENLALRLLGPTAVSVRVPGTREIKVFGSSDTSVWLPIKPSMSIATLRDRLELVPSTGFAKGAEQPVHVRRGLGMEELDAPILCLPGGMVWLHFGGSTYQTLLCSLVPGLHPISGLAGLAVNGTPTGPVLAELAKQENALRSAVEKHFAELEPSLAPGPYQRNLPEQCRRKVVTELFDIPAFQHWLETRHVWQVKRNDSRWKHVRSTLLEGSSS